MKGIKTNNAIMNCNNEKYYIRLSDMGLTACKAGWNAFPNADRWTKAGGVENDRIVLLSACNAIHSHLTRAIVNSALYGASDDCAARVKCNDAEREAIAAIGNLVAALGARYDKRGHKKATAFTVDATSIKALYTLCAGKNTLELCAPATFAKKLVPFLIFMMRGDTIAVAQDAVKAENKSDTADKPKDTIKSLKEERETLNARNAALSQDNVALKTTLDKVREYVRKNKNIDRAALCAMLDIAD